MKIYNNYSANSSYSKNNLASSQMNFSEIQYFQQKTITKDCFIASNPKTANQHTNQITFKGNHLIKLIKLGEKCDFIMSSAIPETSKNAFKKLTDILVKYVETDKLDNEALHSACASYMSGI